MFNDLQTVFKRTWTAFQTELHKREPEDEVAELLSQMRREMAAARAALSEYAATAERLRTALQRERTSLSECERRGQLAAGIGDTETARVAERFAARHKSQILLLEKQVEAAVAEHQLRQREAEQMARLYQKADAERFALVAEVRRGRTRRSLDDLNDAFGEFARMEEAVDDRSHYADALTEMDRDSGSAPPRRPTPEEVEQQLEALKRRMQQQR